MPAPPTRTGGPSASSPSSPRADPVDAASPDDADATQEALIAIVRGLPRFDGRASVRTWMYRVATNACLDELRRRRRRPVLGLPENVTDRSDDAPGLDAAVAERLSIDEAL